ncbi:MAG TPA: type II toxin-antitoxin system VapC family toxin [Pirellulales bacterium]
MSDVVLDASAVLAVLFNEAGADIVAPVLYQATISAVNYSEVLKKTLDKGGDLQIVQSLLARQALKIVPFDVEHATTAAAMLPKTASLGLSFADRACLALGIQSRFEVFTTDKKMSEADLGVRIRLIRRHA